MMAARKGIDSQVKWMLGRLGLSDWASVRASTLPYGVKRRLEIARALGTRPRILLMDEPAAGLNDDESDELLDTIHKIRDDSEFACSMLIIDHDPRLIIRLCDRIHVLDQGRTIAEGTPKEIQQNTAVIESYLGKRYDTGEVTNPAPAGLENGA
jgi:branched-chain amino acid transport system ATP-binding protein